MPSVFSLEQSAPSTPSDLHYYVAAEKSSETNKKTNQSPQSLGFNFIHIVPTSLSFVATKKQNKIILLNET